MFNIWNKLNRVLKHVRINSRLLTDPQNYRITASASNILTSNATSYFSTTTPTFKFTSKNVFEFFKSSSEEDNEHEKAKRRAWRNMKLIFVFFGATGTYLIATLGPPKIGEDGNIIEDDLSSKPIISQYLLRTYKELNCFKQFIIEPSREKLLPDGDTRRPYTLILEMTDVLVHPEWTYKTGWRFKKRPGIDQFLENLSGMYEIVVFTAEQGLTVFPIIEALDPHNHISYKLVRDATHFVDGHHVKNLSKLNRNLSKVIVIDWNLNSVKFHPENVFKLNRWEGTDDDTSLFKLTIFLKAVAEAEVDDIREVLKKYKDQDDPLSAFVKQYKMLIGQHLPEQEPKNNIHLSSTLPKISPLSNKAI